MGHEITKTPGIITFIAMRPSRTYFGPYKEAQNHKKTQGINRFIAIWALQGNPAARHHQKTQGITTFTATWVTQLRKNSIQPVVFLTFLRCGPPGDPRSPQGPRRSPQVPPRSPQGRPWNSQCLPKSPQELSETSSRDKHYINKLPINRPSGRLVSIDIFC